MNKTLALTLPQAQAVYSAMCALTNLGKSTVSVIIPKAPGQNDEPRVTWSFSGVAVRLSRTFHVEDYADQSAFAAAYGLDLQAAGTPASDAQQEAVANANAHLNNAGLPTLRDLDDAVTAGAPQVADFTPHGQRQTDFAMGWNTAMGRVYDRMRSVIVAQRAINNAEQSDL
ncbi:hypothetical protein N5K27_22580 [Pigmentiphaga sp. GD03639]|uniref:hypothetical protein n=1 Tax=Pigmentiphaga sp. GD03639 TaxID=2975354 RepID=UPI00244C5C66|nr:hypothetical protein [Pigmentiphaga sp. GD03639]MDH2239099.1 hypothetical protein [Pigmentiphaga sp. GD03639]